VLPDEECPRCARAANVLSILPEAQPQPSPRKARRGLPWAIAALVASLVLLAVAWCTFSGRREVSGGAGAAGGATAVSPADEPASSGGEWETTASLPRASAPPSASRVPPRASSDAPSARIAPASDSEDALADLWEMCTGKRPGLTFTASITGDEAVKLVQSPQLGIGTADYWIYVVAPKSGDDPLVPFRGGKLPGAEVRALTQFLSQCSDCSSTGPVLYAGGGPTSGLSVAPTLMAALRECAGRDLPPAAWLAFADKTRQLVVSFAGSVVAPNTIRLHPDWRP